MADVTFALPDLVYFNKRLGSSGYSAIPSLKKEKHSLVINRDIQKLEVVYQQVDKYFAVSEKEGSSYFFNNSTLSIVNMDIWDFAGQHLYYARPFVADVTLALPDCVYFNKIF